MPSRLRLFCSLVALAALPATLSAQLRPVQQGNKGPVITYDISFPQAAHHLARVKATFTALPAGPVNIRMARSSPGRYSLTEYAKNVFDVSATDGTGKTLPVTHPDPYSWTVSGHNGTVTFSYTLFADVGNGTYSGFNVEQEHIQPQGTFVYIKSLEFRPVRVTFHRLDPKWTIATQLVPTKDSETFTAPDMQYFFDSPTHLGVIAWRQWSAQQDGKTLTWRVALDDPTEDQAIDAYADGIKKIVAEEGAVYGEFPQYDYGTYTFVACYRDDCGGDGMEHRNSTSVTGNSMNGNGEAGLSTMAHEFFHSWNVKRIRPLGIEPFDYDRANMTPGLWIAEGFTQYYGPLLEIRAGVLQQDRDDQHRRQHHQRRHQLARTALLRPDRDERAGAVPRRRRRGRPSRPQHLPVVLHLRGGHRDRHRPLDARSRQVARHLHADHVASLRQAGDRLLDGRRAQRAHRRFR